MLIESKEKYIHSLINLWHKVFGDDKEYIRLFFKEAYYDSECFAKAVDGEAVSAFYLLKCSIKYEDRIYEGRYLYAAATLPDCRGKGYMSELIDEAIGYAVSAGLDFIALVPASDSLYDYYGRFGFIESMYKYRTEINKADSSYRAFREIADSDEFYSVRKSSHCNMLMYNRSVSDYAFDCLKFGENKIIAVGNNSYYIEGEEFFCGDNSFSYSADALISSLSGEVTVYSNCILPGAEKIRNGMIYSLNSEFKPKDIYMNIALD